MYIILDSLTRMVAPILSFTGEEIWQNLPHKASDDAQSVFLNQFNEKTGVTVDDAFRAKWDEIYAVREQVNKALEEKRNEKVIGKSLEAKVVLTADEDAANRLKSYGELKDVFIVSAVGIESGAAEGVTVSVEKAQGGKCERCWCISEEVGKDAAHPTLCKRCAAVIG